MIGGRPDPNFSGAFQQGRAAHHHPRTAGGDRGDREFPQRRGAPGRGFRGDNIRSFRGRARYRDTNQNRDSSPSNNNRGDFRGRNEKPINVDGAMESERNNNFENRSFRGRRAAARGDFRASGDRGTIERGRGTRSTFERGRGRGREFRGSTRGEFRSRGSRRVSDQISEPQQWKDTRYESQPSDIKDPFSQPIFNKPFPQDPPSPFDQPFRQSYPQASNQNEGFSQFPIFNTNREPHPQSIGNYSNDPFEDVPQFLPDPYYQAPRASARAERFSRDLKPRKAEFEERSSSRSRSSYKPPSQSRAGHHRSKAYPKQEAQGEGEDEHEEVLPTYPQRPSQRGKRENILEKITPNERSQIMREKPRQLQKPQKIQKTQNLQRQRSLKVQETEQKPTQFSHSLNLNNLAISGGEPSELLIRKIEDYRGSDLLCRKYIIYIKKRRSKLAGTSGRLLSYLKNLETLELQRAECFAMCPENEIKQRTEEKLVDKLEKINGSAEPERMIKKFSRSSADKKLDIPEILRPPYILLKTAEYLVTRVLGDPQREVTCFDLEDGQRISYYDFYQFVTDRFRGIVQDIMILKTHCPGILATKNVCSTLEKIVSFYLLSCNELLEDSTFDPKINLTQLSKTLELLMESYKITSNMLRELYSTPTINKEGEILNDKEILKLCDDILYVSPFQAKFISVNLVMQYFEQNSLYHSKLAQCLSDHTLIQSTKSFKIVLKLTSLIEKGYYEQFFKQLESGDQEIEITAVYSFPEYLNTVRTKYMQIIKLYNNPNMMYNPDAEVANDSIVEPKRVVSWNSIKEKLRLENDQNVDFFLAYFYGKRLKGANLHKKEDDEVYIDMFDPSDDVLRKVKHRLKLGSFKIMNDAMNKLGFTKSYLINGVNPKPDMLDYMVNSHTDAYNTLEKFRSMAKLPAPVSSTKLSLPVSQKKPGLLISSTSIQPQSSKAVPSRVVEKVPAPPPQRQPSRERKEEKLARVKTPLSVLSKTLSGLLAKQHKRALSMSFKNWNLMTIAENQRHLDILEAYFEKRRQKTIETCFHGLWDFTIISQIEFKKAVQKPDSTLKCYNLVEGQYNIDLKLSDTFFHSIFDGWIEGWAFVIYASKTGNLKEISRFEIKIIFLLEECNDCDLLIPYFGLLQKDELFDLNGRLQKRLERRFMYKSSSFKVKFEWGLSREFSALNLPNYDIIINFSEINHVPKQIVEKANSETPELGEIMLLNSFRELFGMTKRVLIEVEFKNDEVCYLLDDLETGFIKFHPFNMTFNMQSLQAFFEVTDFAIRAKLEDLEKIVASPEIEYIKVIEETEEITINILISEWISGLLLQIDNNDNLGFFLARNTLLKASQDVLLMGECLSAGSSQVGWLVQIINWLGKRDLEEQILMHGESRFREHWVREVLEISQCVTRHLVSKINNLDGMKEYYKEHVKQRISGLKYDYKIGIVGDSKQIFVIFLEVLQDILKKFPPIYIEVIKGYLSNYKTYYNLEQIWKDSQSNSIALENMLSRFQAKRSELSILFSNTRIQAPRNQIPRKEKEERISLGRRPTPELSTELYFDAGSLEHSSIHNYLLGFC